jgi:hypothetical protein
MADAAWWQRGVIYQIYPRSFMDSDGDGVGDLPGVLSRLDHLTWLGVDALWLSPVYPSPMVDFGYDISDYRDVDPLFGPSRRPRPGRGRPGGAVHPPGPRRGPGGRPARPPRRRGVVVELG